MPTEGRSHNFPRTFTGGPFTFAPVSQQELPCGRTGVDSGLTPDGRANYPKHDGATRQPSTGRPSQETLFRVSGTLIPDRATPTVANRMTGVESNQLEDGRASGPLILKGRLLDTGWTGADRTRESKPGFRENNSTPKKAEGLQDGHRFTRPIPRGCHGPDSHPGNRSPVLR